MFLIDAIQSLDGYESMTADNIAAALTLADVQVAVSDALAAEWSE